jgi:hypothetical protein
MYRGGRIFSTITALLISGAALVSRADAASISLVQAYPDLTLSNGSLSYVYTAICQNSSGSSIGSCSGPRTIPRWDLTYGRLTITGTTLVLNPDGSSLYPVSGDNYSLTVIIGFNSTGTVADKVLAVDPCSGSCSDSGAYSSALSALGTTSHPSFQSGTLITGTPANATDYGYAYNFGWAGQNLAGIFEFVFGNAGGDMGAFGDRGGIIVSTFNLTHPLLAAAPPVETWDSNGVNFWKNGFSATVNVDTFVPVPAAVWLMGSGLLSLFGIRLARKHKDV